MNFLDDMACCNCSKSVGRLANKDDPAMLDSWLQGQRRGVDDPPGQRNQPPARKPLHGAAAQPKDKLYLQGVASPRMEVTNGASLVQSAANGVGKKVIVTAMFSFEAKESEPFPPDPHGDLGIAAGEKLELYPERSQYGWCFCVVIANPSRRGWVPGNYISANGRDSYVSLDDQSAQPQSIGGL